MNFYLHSFNIIVLLVFNTSLVFDQLSGLTSTTLQALSKLISNGDVADDIIGVIRSVISQFSVKNSESDTIEVAVNVRFVAIYHHPDQKLLYNFSDVLNHTTVYFNLEQIVESKRVSRTAGIFGLRSC